MKITYTEIAINNLNEAFEYIDSRNKPAALKILTKIYNSIKLIANNPFIGPNGRRPNTREFYVVSTKYVVVYQVLKEENTIIIVNILHTSQKR